MEKLRPALQQLLELTFGLKDARPTQKTIIETIADGKDLIALLPTGAGKSLCYQLPALTLPGLTLVISPLQSLMHDQVQALQKKGVSAYYLDSTLTELHTQDILKKIGENTVKILYLSPEKLVAKSTASFLLKQHISHICIDEAHCIFSWGEAFRPEYKNIGNFIHEYTVQKMKPIVSAFTATATAETLTVLRKELSLENAQVVCLPFIRANLEYLVLLPPSEAQKRQALLRILQYWQKELSGSALVYAATRRETELLTAWAQSYGFTRAETYHAGLSQERKEKTLKRFLGKGRCLLFCTSAFGMGVDKPDIRVVIHHTPPTTLEAYAQEVGRAGRDGQSAICVLLYRPSDLQRNLRFQEHVLSSDLKKGLQKKALHVENFALSSRCAGKILFDAFLHPLNADKEFHCSCYRCLKPKWWETTTSVIKKTPTVPALQARFFQLKLIRKLRAEKLRVPPYFLGNDVLLQKVAQQAPQTWQELKQIAGLGHVRLFYWGKDILQITQQRVRG
jgi:ATP-dependent DNA helicase RecQ